MARTLDTGLKAEAQRAKWARQRAEDKLARLRSAAGTPKDIEAAQKLLNERSLAEVAAVKAWNDSKYSNVASGSKNSTHGTSPAHKRLARTTQARKGPRSVSPEPIKTRTRKDPRRPAEETVQAE